MKKVLILIIIILILAAIGFWFWRSKKAITFPDIVPMDTFTIESSAFKNNSNIPSKYTCDGENINPPLSISGVPENTQSLVLVVEDPDAPMGTFTHWTIWNISSQTTEIPENSVLTGATEGKTDFGRVGWGGPCPPSGTHRYFFKLYALDTKLDLVGGASKTELEKAMEGHILAGAELIGLYSR